MRTLFTDARVLVHPTDQVHDWLLVEGDSIVATGLSGDAPDADRTVSLDGATLVPAFTDAHVHLPATGLYERGLDLRAATTVREIEEGLRERALSGDDLLFGGNFEDPVDGRVDRHLLDEAVGNRPALLARADMHSCVVSSALLANLDVEGLEGVDRDASGDLTGYLREEAAGRAWLWFDRNLSKKQARDALTAAVTRAYSKGVACVHEMHIVEWRGWDTLDVLLEVAEEVALGVVTYVADRDVERIAALGTGRIGGDYFLDGSFGSHTAWLTEPYATPPPEGSPASGISYRDEDDLLAFFAEAQRLDLQVGVHAIGDAAIEQAIRCWEKVASDVGEKAVRDRGHRIEHFECATDDHIRRAAALGLRASVQPAFDRLWGGEEGLYASRIGAERSLEMNRFRSMLEGGLTVGAGSDSTVTPLDPLLQIASLRDHHVAGESLDPRTAFDLHVRGARMMAGDPGLDGTMSPGATADIAALDTDPLSASPESLVDAEVTGTWIGGRRVWPPDQAETP